MQRALIAAAVGLAGCGDPGGAPDAAVADAGFVDGAPAWATYTIAAGQHPATITGGGPDNPLRAIVMVGGRDYQFAFDGSAEYVITMPAQPNDQLDWNKLPGLSDCGTADLSVDGAMFGWRWRVDLEPPVLEITAYANNAGTHLWLDPPLVALTRAELAAAEPLRYRLALDGDRYRFTIAGTIAGRPIDVAGALTRACPAFDPRATKWAAGLYFGGTSVAPSTITGRVLEIGYAP